MVSDIRAGENRALEVRAHEGQAREVRLSEADLQAAELAHQERADALTSGWRERRSVGEAHAVDDFMFTYYPFKPALLRRWHPGAGVRLAGAAGLERAEWKWYRQSRGTDLLVDARELFAARAQSIAFISRLLQQTALRPAQFGCFGLHEWAMVYKVADGHVRHESIPLRLTAEQTDKVVESHRIRCSHFDAFRFFTPEARGRNSLLPSRENQESFEQAGCLHAGMDVYKWAIKLGPIVPGVLLLDSFDLAREIRQVDMRASPYDVSSFGLSAIRIETAEGKAEYSAFQHDFATRSNILRSRLVESIVRAESFAAAG
ncbi:3-methyladenine DNA glycosylase [Subtercola frigoramans]|uniref:3-methyladenine DNA glycosylase n=1 Tax=Subtercola frigoramans TaxID=120298 RepID=A0ABS2L6R2_9MICO|nr:3-methyladenine DNA glycosylase [Subtercola frigoramans]MBM7472415.1 hypothetical protein [Subtercola frigoramans]